MLLRMGRDAFIKKEYGVCKMFRTSKSRKGETMDLIPIQSQKSKHKGCIFLKRKGSTNHFVVKIYSGRISEAMSRAIIRAAKEVYYEPNH